MSQASGSSLTPAFSSQQGDESRGELIMELVRAGSALDDLIESHAARIDERLLTLLAGRIEAAERLAFFPNSN